MFYADVSILGTGVLHFATCVLSSARIVVSLLFLLFFVKFVYPCYTVDSCILIRRYVRIHKMLSLM